MGKFKLTEYDLLIREPESMTVGQLNQAVKDLREALYQARIKNCQHETKEILHSGIKS